MTCDGARLANGHLRPALALKNYDVSYDEHAGGDDPARWREALTIGLLHFHGSTNR